jgi:hypothetical protein
MTSPSCFPVCLPQCTKGLGSVWVGTWFLWWGVLICAVRFLIFSFNVQDMIVLIEISSGWAGRFFFKFLFWPEYENLKINKGMCIDQIFSYSSPSSLLIFFFFGFEETSPLRKAHFVGPGEGVKPRLSQALTRGARPDLNSRPAVQIPNPLPSRYAFWGPSSLLS